MRIGMSGHYRCPTVVLEREDYSDVDKILETAEKNGATFSGKDEDKYFVVRFPHSRDWACTEEQLRTYIKGRL